MRGFVACSILLVTAATANAELADGRIWLDKMSRAMSELNYEGTFVYLHGNQMETVRILHSVNEKGEERERMISLTGAAREVIRDSNHVTCILPDSESVVVDKSHPRKPFPAAFHQDLDKLANYYDFHVLDDDRMVGVPVRVIAIQPRDKYRYGYRMWLGKKTNMLLKFDLTDGRGMPVEQMMFTDFKVRDHVALNEFEPALSGAGYTRSEVALNDQEQDSSPSHSWRVDRLPEGFMLTHHNQHFLPASSDRVEHMVFGDGLATVSVYVEKPDPNEENLQGISSMGAVNAYGARIAGHQITAVGEVPEATVEMIARSARPVQ